MADIINRLLLDTSNFDAKLSSSKKGVNNYQDGITKLATSAGVKLAGGLGLAMGAGEAFNKVLNSSQTLGDMTARNMAALKTSVDEFFYSVGSGNLGSFINGLGGIIDKAKEAYSALDQLGNTQISHGVFSAANQSSISEGQYIAKNKFAPIDERLSGFGMWGNALASQKSANDALQRELINAATSAVASKIPSDINISLPDLMQAFETDLLNPSKRDETKATSKRVYDAHVAYANAHTDDAEAVRKDAESRKKYLVIHAMLEKYTDDELKAIAAQIQQYYQTTTALNSLAREYNENANKFNNSNKAVKGFTPVQSLEGYKVYNPTINGSAVNKLPAVLPDGSIAALNEQISAKNKELINATTVQARAEIQKTINELEARKINLNISTEKEMFRLEHGENRFDISKNDFHQYESLVNELVIKRKELVDALTADASDDTIFEIQKIINELEARKINIEAEISIDSNRLNKEIAGITSPTNIGNIKLPHFIENKAPVFKSPISNKDISALEDYQNELYGVCDVMRFMSGITKESESSWLNWGASLLQSIAQAIPAIRALIPALAAKTAGEAASSAAQIPLVGWLAAGGAALSMISLFASFPKFANGGIVSGRTLAEVGEYAGASSNPEVIAPLNKLKEYISPNSNTGFDNVSFSAEYKLRGSDIYTSLTNYLKKTGKKI